VSTFVVVLLIVGGLVIVGRIWVRTMRRHSRAFLAMAQRHRGSIVRGGIFRDPRLKFAFGTTRCQLRLTGNRRRWGGRSTVIEIEWPDRRLELVVVSRDHALGASWTAELASLAPIDPTFDAGFLVASNQPDDARDILIPAVRWQIELLANLPKRKGIAIRLANGRWSIAKPGIIEEQLRMEELIRLAIEFVSHVRLAGSQDVSFVGTDVASTVESIKCPVCANDITAAMVVCVRCKTPHCLDCWEYNGRCGMFACGETRYLSTAG